MNFLKILLVFMMLIVVTNAHLMMIIGMVMKIASGIIKMDMKIFGPMAIKGIQTMIGIMANGFGGGKGNGQAGENGGFGFGGQGNGAANGHGNGAANGHGNGQTNGQTNGQSNGGWGFGFGGQGNGAANGHGNGATNGQSNGQSNGGWGFGFGGQGGLGGKGNGAANGHGNGATNGNGQANGNMGGNMGGSMGGSMGGGLFDSIVGGIRGILGQYAGIAGGLLGGSKSWAETVQSLIQSGLGNFFKIFGGMAASSQAGIGNLFAKSLEVFTTVLKLKMGGLNMLDSLIQSEIKVIKGVLEGQFTNMAGIFGSLGAKAPSVSGSIGFGFKMAKKNFDEGKKKLDAPTRQGLDKMMGSLREAQSKVGKMIQAATPQHKKDMGVLFNVIRNMHMMSMALNH